MRNLFKSTLAAALLCSALSMPSEAATPVQGQAAGNGYITIKVNKDGHVVGAYVADNNSWNATVALSTGTAAALKAAPGAGLKACITGFRAFGISTTTAVAVTILDGVTVKWSANMLAGGTAVGDAFPTPICGSNNAALNVQLSGAPTGAVQANAQGYVEPN